MLEAMKELLVYYDFLDLSSFVFDSRIIFMLALAFVWIAAAVIEDFKRREVENWWNFSLIIFVLAFRAFWSISDSTLAPFLWGIAGLTAGFVLANAFYYSRIFAGGDAKLLMALGAVLPLSLDWRTNTALLALFVMFLIFSGAIYGMAYSIALTILKFSSIKSEFNSGFKRNKRIFRICLAAGIISAIAILIFQEYLLLILSFLIVIFPWLYVYASAIEKKCLDKMVKARDLTAGDWLVKPLKVKNRIIKPNWEGLSENELNYIRKNYHGKAFVKYGIPFTPAFFIALLLLILFLW